MQTIPVFVCFVILWGGIFGINQARGQAHGQAAEAGEGNFPLKVSLSAGAGLLYGQAEEIVYYAPDAPDTYLSQLLWDLKPLVYYGGSISVLPARPEHSWGLYAEFSIKQGIPMPTGIMEDRDWMAANYGLSHYSQHDTETVRATLADLRLGVSMPLPLERLSIRLFTEFAFMDFYWDSQDGYLQYAQRIQGDVYGNWNESLPKEPFSGPAISYAQQWVTLAPGFILSVAAARFLVIDAGCSLTPLIMSSVEDNHWVRELRFNDHLWGGLLVEPRAALQFQFTPSVGLSCMVSWRFITDSRGDTISWNTAEDDYRGISPGAAGAGYQVLDAGLFMKYSF